MEITEAMLFGIFYWTIIHTIFVFFEDDCLSPFLVRKGEFFQQNLLIIGVEFGEFLLFPFVVRPINGQIGQIDFLLKIELHLIFYALQGIPERNSKVGVFCFQFFLIRNILLQILLYLLNMF